MKIPRPSRAFMNDILLRAASWVGVPYSQEALHTNEHGTYRTDCSGYVSMAWGLTCARGGLNTVDLVGVSTLITKDELQPGDVLIDANGDRTTRHATIFVGWADVRRESYWAFEQRGGYGTTIRVVPYPYDDRADNYRPYRRPRLVAAGQTSQTAVSGGS
ncbi:NlpC/P60 family protein [Lentzea aerocolonigenes]|nr:NlpC/P60 family protein [Lentzea aerocolonigenes]